MCLKTKHQLTQTVQLRERSGGSGYNNKKRPANDTATCVFWYVDE